jgi:hypothetical protein
MHGNRRITDRQAHDPFPLLVILGQGGYAKHGAYLQETPQ